MSDRTWFQPLPYMLAVLCAVIVATGGFGPPLVIIVMVLLVPAAWLAFLPSTLLALWLLRQRNWRSLWAYLLMWTLSAVSTGTIMLLVTRWPVQDSGLGQFGQQLIAIAVGGLLAGYVYWGVEKR